MGLIQNSPDNIALYGRFRLIYSAQNVSQKEMTQTHPILVVVKKYWPWKPNSPFIPRPERPFPFATDIFLIFSQ